MLFWLLVLVFLSWFVACIAFLPYLIVSCLMPCIPGLKCLSDFLLACISFPYKCSDNMVNCRSCDSCQASGEYFKKVVYILVCIRSIQLKKKKRIWGPTIYCTMRQEWGLSGRFWRERYVREGQVLILLHNILNVMKIEFSPQICYFQEKVLGCIWP